MNERVYRIRRVAVAATSTLLLALTSTLLFAPSTAHAAVTDVTIYDDADVLDDEVVAKEIGELSSAEDVHIAVLTSDDPSLTDDGYDEDVKTLIDNGDYADIQGSSGQTLKPDVVLISISPDLRKLGTYTGDGVSRADQIADKAVGEMKSPARAGDWDQTAIAGAGSSLKAVNGGYEREQKERDERLQQNMDKYGPVLLNSALLAGLLLAVAFGVAKIGPRIVNTISDLREEKRLLAWSPSPDEVARSVAYWQSLDQRLDDLGSESAAMLDVIRQVSDEEIGRAVVEMEQNGAVPDWAKRSTKVKALIQEGIQGGGTNDFWSRRVRPLTNRVRTGGRDHELRVSVDDASEAADAALRFVKKYGDEIALSPADRATIKEGAESLRETAEQAKRMADAQEIAPWRAATQINTRRHEFESFSKRTLQSPVRHGMSEDRRRALSHQGLFADQSFLSALLVYSALSSANSRSSSHSDSSSSSSSYSSISSSISTSGFSGGSGSF